MQLKVPKAIFTSQYQQGIRQNKQNQMASSAVLLFPNKRQ